MKINAVNFLTNDKFDVSGFNFFISGNDEALIKRVEGELIVKFKKNGFLFNKKQETLALCSPAPSLFGSSEVCVVTSSKEITEEKIKSFGGSDLGLVISSKNSSKDKKIKKIFEKSKTNYLIDCYELDQTQKTKCIETFLKNKGISINKESFWFMIEKLSNKFVFLEKDMEKVFLYEEELTLENLKKIFSSKNELLSERLFYNIFLKNSIFAVCYSESVQSPGDFYKLFNSVRVCFEIMINSKNQTEAVNLFPKYLFKERDSFVKIYKNINEKKIKKISLLLLKTEKLVRKNPNLYKSIGLRFLLNLKRTIVS